MASALKQVLVLGGLVAGAFGVAALLNGRRKRRRGRRVAEVDEVLDDQSDLQETSAPTEVAS